MTLLVDTSVWSLAFRRNEEATGPEVGELQSALSGGDTIVTTGFILQELLQGLAGPQAHKDLVTRFSALPFVTPDRQDHIEAAEVRNRCRRASVQLGTIDALLVQLSIRHQLTMLTADKDFEFAAKHCPLKLWKPRATRKH